MIVLSHRTITNSDAGWTDRHVKHDTVGSDAVNIRPRVLRYSRACVAVGWYPEKGMTAFQRYHGLLLACPTQLPPVMVGSDSPGPW